MIQQGGIMERNTRHATTLIELLSIRAQQTPDRTAYRFIERSGGRTSASISYGELDAQAQAAGSVLRAEGACREPVLLLVGSGLEFLVSFFGILYADAIAVPLVPPHPARGLGRLRAVVEDSQARFLIAPPSTLQRLYQFPQATGLLAGRRVFTPQQLLAGGAGLSSPVSIDDAVPALLQYTSGSTATPKAVCISNANLLHNASLIAGAMQLGPESVCVSWLPLYHDMGLMTGVIGPLYNGCVTTLMAPAIFATSPATWLQAVTRDRATVTGAPNFAYESCLERITEAQSQELDLSSLEVAFCGAETVRASMLERFAARFAPCGFRHRSFFPCYGLAEATLMVSGGPKDEPPKVMEVQSESLQQRRRVTRAGVGEATQRLVSTGQVLAEQEVTIVDPQTRRRLPDDEVGEIWVRGRSVGLGYWNRPDETDRVFRARLADSDEAGFLLRTGDLGFMHAGRLTIVGRLKDLIVIRGVNHHPQDIESTMEGCHPAIVPHAGAAMALDDEGDEALLLVQELKRGWCDDPRPVLEAIARDVAEQHGLRPRLIVLVRHSTIPRTTSGKIQRSATRAAFLSGGLHVIAQSQVLGRS